MATTLTAPATESVDLVHLAFPIVKFEKDANGDLVVYGKATDGSVDSDEQIVDPSFSGKAIADWLASGANVRVQHNSQRDPAGVGIEADTDKEGATWVKSLVVEPVAKTLVEKGALRAYSVGIARPKIVRDSVARGGRIVDGQIVEISLVDRPANKNCGIQLVKAATVDGAPEWVGEVWGVQDEAETINVDLPKNASISFSPADLAKLMGVKKSLEADLAKKDVDPSVGGGVDRDKIPAADFAGRDRSFPIVTPGDVSDAASSIGRAGSDNYSSDQLKANIKRIAHRKGPSFVAELPDSWKDEAKKSQDVPDDVDDKVDTNDEKLSHQVQKGDDHEAGCTCEKCAGAMKATETDADEEAKPDTTKGAKKCPGCGKNFHADSKLRNCSGCGKKLPKADKAAKKSFTLNLENQRLVSDADLAQLVEAIGKTIQAQQPAVTAEVEKKAKAMCPGCGANQSAKHAFCTECGKSMAKAKPVTKNHDFTCLGCGKDLDKGEKFCPGCGKKNPGYLPEADRKIEANKTDGKDGSVTDKTTEPKAKKGKPTPGVDGGGPAAAAIQPVPAHREPDGQYIEDLEHDAGLPTDPDSKYEMKAAQRVKATGAPYDLGALHDLTCPGFHPAHAAKAHPSVQLDRLELDYWEKSADDAVYTSTLAGAQKAAELLRAAAALKADGGGTGYFEHALNAHKAMQAANRSAGPFPSPTVISPTQFQRPVLTAGQSKPGTDYDPPNAPGKVPASGGIHAEDFTRGPLTTGQAAQSPSNKSVGEAALLVHDHLAELYPALCPLGAEVAKAAEPEAPAVEAKVEKATVEPKAKKGKKGKKGKKMPFTPGKNQAADADSVDEAADKSVATDEVVNKAATVDADMIKSAMLEVTGGLQEQLAEVVKALQAEQKKSKKLAEQVDQMANMADPRVYAVRSAGTAPQLQKAVSPVGYHPVADTAERTQAALLSVLHDNARNSSDPSVREAAWNEIYRMTGIGGQ